MMSQKMPEPQWGIACVPMLGEPIVNRLFGRVGVSQSYTTYLAKRLPWDRPITLNLVWLKCGFAFILLHAS